MASFRPSLEILYRKGTAAYSVSMFEEVSDDPNKTGAFSRRDCVCVCVCVCDCANIPEVDVRVSPVRCGQPAAISSESCSMYAANSSSVRVWQREGQ